MYVCVWWTPSPILSLPSLLDMPFLVRRQRKSTLYGIVDGINHSIWTFRRLYQVWGSRKNIKCRRKNLPSVCPSSSSRWRVDFVFWCPYLKYCNYAPCFLWKFARWCEWAWNSRPVWQVWQHYQRGHKVAPRPLSNNCICIRIIWTYWWCRMCVIVS